MTRLSIWCGGAALCLAALLTYGFGANNPNPLRWAILAAFALSACVVWRGEFRRDTASGIAILFVVYAALSVAWSPDWREGILRLQSIAVLVAAFVIFRQANREWLLIAVPAAACVAIVLEIFISIFEPGIHGALGNENFQAEFLVMAAPLAGLGALTWRGTPLKALALAIPCAGIIQAIFFNSSHAEVVGFAGVGGLAFIAMCARRKYGLAAATVAIVAAGIWLAIPTVSKEGTLWSVELLHSASTRLNYLTAALEIWADNPVLGAGLGSFNYLFPDYGDLPHLTRYIGAAHNEYAQSLASLGLIGTGIFAIGLWCLLWRGAYNPARMFGIASVFACAAFALVGFPLQNAATALVAVAALAVAGGDVDGEAMTAPAWPVTITALAVAVPLGWFNWRVYEGEKHFSNAELWSAHNSIQTFAAVNTAHKSNPWEGRFRLQMLPSLEQLARSGKKVNIHKSAQDKAYEISASAAPRHPWVLAARASYLLNENGDENELKSIIETMKRTSPSLQQTWIIAARFAHKKGQTADIIKAIESGLQAGVPEWQMKRLANSVNMELTKQ